MFDLTNIKNSAQRSFGRGSLYLQKYSPEILLGVGIVGMVTTVVMASKATLKAGEIVNQFVAQTELVEQAINKPDQYSVEDAAKDKAIIYVQTGLKLAKLYGPTIGVGAASLTAILASHGIMSNRQASLIAAYAGLSELFKNYRARVVEQLGEEADRDYILNLKDEVRTETEVDEEGKKTKVKKKTKVPYDHQMKSIYSRFFDESNPLFRDSRLLNKAFLQAQQNYVNDLLIIRGHVFLNEVYERLGFPHTKEGAIVGWVLKEPEEMKAEYRDGYIDFGMYDVENDPGREFVNGTNPTILLDFNVDGMVFNQI